jgi:Dockerin type I domain
VNGLSVWEGGRYGWFDANGNLLPTITTFDGINPSPGDFNADGSVDAADLLAWQTQFAGGASEMDADGNGDGDVDGADLLLWQANLQPPQAEASQRAVPEPGLAMLLWCAAALTALIRVLNRA